MKKEIREYVIEKTRELIAAPTCSAETKAAAQSWLDAAGTAAEEEETKKYVEELEADIMPLDNLIAFASSEEGRGYFGADAAEGIVSHAEDLKKAGERYCDCPACLAVAAILEKKEELLNA